MLVSFASASSQENAQGTIFLLEMTMRGHQCTVLLLFSIISICRHCAAGPGNIAAHVETDSTAQSEMDSAGGAEAAAATAITLGGGRKLLETCESNTTGLNCTLCTQNQYSRSCDVSCQSTRTCSGHGRCRKRGDTCSCYEPWEGNDCSIELYPPTLSAAQRNRGEAASLIAFALLLLRVSCIDAL